MRNLGGLDRSLRVLLGIGMLVVFFQVDSNWRYVGLLGVFPLLTAALGTCIIYRWLGISTYRGSKGAQHK
ncbi:MULTISPECIES: YgaP family membrane protein [Paenibacillus]|uniref:DUF2892 domain-containing protein n=1 Tax=Paenibacillus elgii TaxID=189691 RepID=A0A161S6I3_9BACL|nr:MULTISPECIES: DUF2892 domain-containing protein [Paenibacillus]KZE74905.1 hypothetical protein AV654_28595 [Paenibacillus elgii]NEN85695.1 DUF2892 domain-containing protein [Paenibacillus elgii]PUA35461.1 DUF2892 domain-containing protein [Paenibacillus elgii]